MPYIDDWRLWLTAAGIAGVDPERGARFDSSLAAYRAAEEGLGLAIGRERVLGNALEAGRLVAPFDMRLASAHAYYLACAEGTENVRKIAAFRRWLLGEIAAQPPEASERRVVAAR
jgi:LysR family glycine cleavage system transcriptional activator